MMLTFFRGARLTDPYGEGSECDWCVQSRCDLSGPVHPGSVTSKQF